MDDMHVYMLHIYTRTYACDLLYLAIYIHTYSLLLTYIGRVMTLSCKRRYMRYSHLLGDFRHDFGPQLDLGLRPRCSASAQYHAFRLVQQKAISNTYISQPAYRD